MLRKVLTLLSSLSLVTLFLTYQSGVFKKLAPGANNHFQPSHNGGNISSIPSNDTGISQGSSIQSKGSTDKNTSTSASTKLMETDSTGTNNAVDFHDPPPEKEFLSSSKSMIIFKPRQATANNTDSIHVNNDTSMTPKQKSP